MDLRLQLKEAAKRLGTGATSVAQWESGARRPAIRQWPALLRFLGYDPRPQEERLEERLKHHREARGWSQDEAARRLGVNPSVLWRWETGRRQPKGRYLERVYSFLEDDLRPAPSTTGERLKRYREQSGVTLTAMAKCLGVAQSTLCRWESGEREPSGVYLDRVERELATRQPTSARRFERVPN